MKIQLPKSGLNKEEVKDFFDDALLSEYQKLVN